MDFRTRRISPEQLAAIKRFIVGQKLGYQPFVFSDDLEVGAGQHFIEHARHNHLVSTPDPDPALAEWVTARPDFFRASNAQLRRIYELFLDFIQGQLGGVFPCSFAEVGCNTGYFLYGLALRGARRCVGLDYTPNADVFAVFNAILRTRCEFRFAEWDSLRHRFNYAAMPQVDVGLSIGVSCHFADPLHHLAHLCDHSRKAVFVWCPATDSPDLSIRFGEPGRYPEALAWPLSFDNDVRPSARLLRMALERAGFEDIRELPCPDWLPPEWQNWFRSQKGYLAFRTANVRTALTPGGGKRRRAVPSEAPVKPRTPVGEIRLVKHDVQGFNVVGDGIRYYATLTAEGPFDLARFRSRGYHMQFSGRTLASVICRILKAAPTPLKPRHPVGSLRLVLEDVYGFNVVSDALRYYAIRASEGVFDLAKFHSGGYRVQFSGRTLGSVICRLLKGIRSAEYAGEVGAART